MSWKNLSMMKKLIIGFGFVGLLLFIISTGSYIGFRNLAAQIDKDIYLNELSEIMLKREIDHMNWQSRVIVFLLDDNATTLKVKTDDHACKLGKWLYSDKRKKAEAALPGLTQLLRDLEKPHKDLHDSAKEIQQTVEANDGFREEAMEIYNVKSRQSLQKIKAVLHSISAQIQDHVTEGNAALQADVKSKKRNITILTVVALFIAFLFSYFLARSITSTLNQSVDLATALANGDLTKRLDLDQKDELGILSKALNSMADKLNAMIGDMNSEVLGLASTSNELNYIAQSMSENSSNVSERAISVAAATEELSANMTSVAAASEEASTNVNIVATASEEVTSSIAEVDVKTKEARAITEDAVRLANSSSQKVDALGSAADQISKVTGVITEISDQTNLLALNATIEAARAGEAGKGFKVVAGEIKSLAGQTSQATDDIKEKIAGIQNSTDDTVQDVTKISQVISDVNEIVTTIAAAIEEQSASATEVAQNIEQVSMGIGEVNENVAQSSQVSSEIAKDISRVNLVAEDMSKRSTQMNHSAMDLTNLSSKLRDMVSIFKISR